MIREGARADGVVCSFPTVTWPNHTTLVTGVSPAKHGVIGNSYLDRKTAAPVALLPDPLHDLTGQCQRSTTIGPGNDRKSPLPDGLNEGRQLPPQRNMMCCPSSWLLRHSQHPSPFYSGPHFRLR